MVWAGQFSAGALYSGIRLLMSNLTEKATESFYEQFARKRQCFPKKGERRNEKENKFL